MNKGLPWEIENNTGVICDECADALRSRQLTAEEIAMIEPGAHVKVCNLDEGFWVLVTEVNGSTIRGTVDNDLLKDHGFDYGDLLELDVSEVYMVEPKVK